MKPKAKSSASLTQRIRRDIERKILSGAWPPGQRIPFEHELTAKYGCSRMTVNRVLTVLAEIGMVKRRRRAGTFVARQHPFIESIVVDIPDLPAEVASRGLSYSFKLIDRQRHKARKTNPYELELGPGEPLLALRGLHLANEAPFALEERVINVGAVPEVLQIDFSSNPPGTWLLQHMPWTSAKHRISAIAASPQQAALLKVAAGTPCLVLERQTWRGEPGITYVKQIFLGDSYDLVARFSPGRQSL